MRGLDFDLSHSSRRWTRLAGGRQLGHTIRTYVQACDAGHLYCRNQVQFKLELVHPWARPQCSPRKSCCSFPCWILVWVSCVLGCVAWEPAVDLWG